MPVTRYSNELSINGQLFYFVTQYLKEWHVLCHFETQPL